MSVLIYLFIFLLLNNGLGEQLCNNDFGKCTKCVPKKILINSRNIGGLRKNWDNNEQGFLRRANLKMSSCCLRCELCIAIANQINRTLTMTHEKMFPILELSDENVTLLIRKTCDESFTKYSLREIGSTRLVSDILPGSILIPTSLDEFWNEKLTEKCHEMMDYIGIENLYKYWLCNSDELSDENSPELVGLLCKNNLGILRDCKNIL